MTGLHRKVLLPLVLTAGFGVGAGAAQPPASHIGPAGKSWALVEEYCAECHNAVDWAGSVAFDTMSPDGVADEPRIWEAAIRKLQGRLMPPPGKKQPTQAAIDETVSWLQTTLDDAAAKAPPYAGFVGVQRLNRDEYERVVKDLLGVEIKAADLLPAESEVDGFVNVAAALSVSPYFIDQFIATARTVARIAVGDPAPKVTNSFYPVPADISQEGYIPGFPLGTRGGMKFRHNFPANGEYRFNINDLDVGLYPSAAETRHTLVVLVDGKEVFRQSLGGPEDLALVDREGADGRRKLMSRFQNIPVTLNAGPHEVLVTFIERAQAESDEVVGGAAGFGGGFGRLRVPRMLDGVQILGPSGTTSVSRTVSRDRIFVCQPAQLLERGANPHLQDWWGRTPLYIATDMDSFNPRGGGGSSADRSVSALDVMRLLLERGVNPNPQLNMHRPGRGGNSGRFTDDLLTVGATPLLRAAIGFDTEAMQLLLAHGALVDLPNGMGVTPLMAAAGLGVSIRDPRGNYGGDVQARVLPTLEILVKAGAAINARVTDTTGHTARIARPSTMTDRQGQTALYGPINWGWVEVVQYLLDHSARVDVADANGRTPLDAANGNAGGRDYKKTPEIIAMIEKAGGKPGETGKPLSPPGTTGAVSAKTGG